MYICRLIFFCDLVNLYLPVHFLSMWLNGIISITNSEGEFASPWKIPFWIFTAAKIFPPAINSTFQFFIATVKNVMTLSDIL